MKNESKEDLKKYQEFREELEQLSIKYFDYLPKSDVIVGMIYEAVDCAMSDERSEKSIIALMESFNAAISDWIVNDDSVRDEIEEMEAKK